MARSFLRSVFTLLAVACAFSQGEAHGQSFTAVQASSVIVDNGGSGVNPPAGTQLCFLGTDQKGVPVTYTPAGGVPQSGPVCGSLNGSGALTAGLQVANTSLATPVPLYFTITVVNGATTYLTIPLVQVNGTLFSFDLFALAPNGTASGVGYPHLGCSAGSKFVSTTLPPGQNSFEGANGNGGCSWNSFPNVPFCPAGTGYLTAQTSGGPLCISPETSNRGAPIGFCVNNQKYTQIDAAPGGFSWGCVNNAWQNIAATGGGNAITGLTGDVTAAGPGNVPATLASVGTSGTYLKVTTDTKGRVTSGSPTLSLSDLPFTYSGNTTELATVSGSLPPGSIVAVDANGNLIPATHSNVFPGTIAAANVTGLAPSATIDTTNASNISTGTLDAGRLPTIINSSTTGNSATASAFDHAPQGCLVGQVATGINADGSAVCIAGGGGGVTVPPNLPALASDASGNVIAATQVPLLNAANTFTNNNTIATAIPATSSVNNNSPTFSLSGSFWNGTASGTDIWEWQDVVGSGANPSVTYTLNHTTTNQGTAITVPSVNIPYNTNVLNLFTGGQVDALLVSATDTVRGVLVVQAGGAITGSSTNVNSGSLETAGSYFNGTTGVLDKWDWIGVLGAGTTPTSTYTLSHTGSSGATAISMPFPISLKALQVTAAMTPGAGWQTVTGAACPIAAGVGLFCGATINLQFEEPDTAYDVTGCQIDSNTSGVPIMTAIGAKTINSFSADMANVSSTAAVAGGTITCVVTHN